MSFHVPIGLACWGAALLYAAAVATGRAKLNYSGGPALPLVIGIVALAFNLAAWSNLLGPGEAAGLTFGPLFAGGGFAVAFRNRTRGAAMGVAA